MPNFVTGPSGLLVPIYPKSDLSPVPFGGDPAKFVAAIDWNAFGAALEDIRAFLRAAKLLATGLTTTGLSTGDVGVLSGNNTMTKADAALLSTARPYGVNDGLVGAMVVSGPVLTKFVVGLTLLPNQPAYLASGANAGKLTNVPPASGCSVEVGTVQDVASYAGLQQALILFQPKQVIQL